MDNQALAERLKYQRQLKGLSQEELSHRTNVAVRTIQRIEKAEVNPHLNTVKLLAVALEVEVSDLLPLDNPKEETIKKKWLLLLHAIPLLGIFIPLCNVLLPLFIWIHKREDNPIYDKHGVKVINFQITVLLLAVLSFVSLLTIEKWGFIIFITTLPICVGVVIFNIIYVLQKERCYYPLSIPFLKFKPGRFSKVIALLLLMVTFSQCATVDNNTIQRLDGSRISNDSIAQKINVLAKEGNVQGMAIAVFNDKQPVYKNTLGFKNLPERLTLTDSTNIYGASLSKAVFSVLVMKLVENNVIDLDTPLESYLPKKLYEYKPLTRWHDHYADLKEDSLYHKITARMCLAHTTGFANWRFVEPDQKLKVNGEPGTKYSYSGEGFVYLQVVLEKLTGKGLEQLAKEYIFDPLRMTKTSYQWQPAFESDFAYGHTMNGRIYRKDKDNEPRGGSTLETTADDYIKFLTAVLNHQLISEKSTNQMFSPQVKIHSLTQFGEGSNITTDTYRDIKLSYALGWGYLETPHGKGVFKGGHGNGFQHFSILFPESGKGVLIMSNSDNAEGIYQRLLEYILADSSIPWEWLGYVPYK
ncbi:serine hydrolase [Aquimarina intermedia]|uniref:CubicO group peptidase (Beta-lactamase class C family) n=1 Tax=Aquimarina intermedia TaxID=350814 RepID=A0A5S5C2A4_9FLAO|nr:serine hydrolase [Aquimarina intermedia]TYP73551.1 CubicO group peptidase (beta-lactamase class C family) [Aquimarina intermedia]